MESILDRIEKIAVNEGIKIATMERNLGASKGVLSRAISNRTDIQSKWIRAVVENYPAYSEEWLLTGNGNMLKASSITNTITGNRNVGSVGGHFVNIGSNNNGATDQNRLISDYESKIDRLHKLNEKLLLSEKDLQTKVNFLEQQVKLQKENLEIVKELLEVYKKGQKMK